MNQKPPKGACISDFRLFAEAELSRVDARRPAEPEFPCFVTGNLVAKEGAATILTLVGVVSSYLATV